MGEIRRTIVPIADCFSERRVLKMLPPEHRIMAIRPDPARGLTDYLIEGPLVPDVAKIIPVFTMTMVESDKFKLTGRWQDRGEEWIIGEWSSMDAYREEMDAL